MRMIDFFDRGADLQAARTCVRDSSVSMTYAQVRSASYQIARRLRECTLAPGERAAVYGPT